MNSVKGFFSQTDNISKIIVDEILAAKQSVLLAMYTLTDIQMIDALKKAQLNQVKVILIFDQKQMHNNQTIFFTLNNAGITFRTLDIQNASMHHKFIVIDDITTITGSFNWTYSAQNKNYENIVVIKDSDVAEQYKREFDSIWKRITSTSIVGFHEKISKIDDKTRALVDIPLKGMRFAYIPPTGEKGFLMGSPSDEIGRREDETQHSVVLTKGFYMQTTQVTQRQWKAIMGSNPSYFQNCGDECPVEQVSWEDTQTFITKLNEMGHRTYSLPTEAQWEYAARAGTTGTYAGNGDLMKMGWDTDGKTHPVALKQPNAWGIYDMHGNVWEWCQDWYGGDYSSGVVTDPVGYSGSGRVVRGGGWYTHAGNCRSALRRGCAPSKRDKTFGFRLVCSAGQQ